MQDNHVDVAIVGGGPGGYTAALYCARAGLETLVLEKLSAGGQMATTSQVENYPGFDEGIDGFELAEKMQRGAQRFGARTLLAEVTGLDLKSSPKVLETSAGRVTAFAVILATGASPRALGVQREDFFRGRGVAYCATCDGMLYRGKTVVVVGGGNSAAEDARLTPPEGALQTARALLQSGLPLYGVDAGHQLLAVAAGCRLEPLPAGHRGPNHPVHETGGATFTTTQRHGLTVVPESVDPARAAVTHVNRNDGSVEGLRYAGCPAFSTQYLPDHRGDSTGRADAIGAFLSAMAQRKEGGLNA